jgi:hypothetical protein
VTVKSANDWVWQPPGETIEAIAAVLSAHWTAAKTQQLELFAPRAGNWLRQSPWFRQLSWSRELTTLREAADSSGTLPDPHPC